MFVNPGVRIGKVFVKTVSISWAGEEVTVQSCGSA